MTADAGAPEPLDRRGFDAAELVASHPPRFQHPNKVAVYAVAAAGPAPAGRIDYTRWPTMPLPAQAQRPDDAFAVTVPGFYDYRRFAPDAIEWHVNFADPVLFVAYRGGLFAQDETQVVEHPALGSLREALGTLGADPFTEDPTGPTPILVAGVERRAAVATDPDPAAGRPLGLYGNRFAAADVEAVRAATSPVRPPTVTNIVAIAAPGYGTGAYTAAQIERILVTAFSGFRAAAIESARLAGADPVVVVHSGYWGCGAFGGNRTLMSALQVFAAVAAGVGRLVLHTGAPGGEAAALDGIALCRELSAARSVRIEDLIEALAVRGFRWGASDGN